MLTILVLAISSALILIIKAGDPKRLRAAGIASRGHSPVQRRLLALGTILPGVACLVLGDPAAFLIWLGWCAVMGWAVAVLPSRRSAPDRQKSAPITR